MGREEDDPAMVKHNFTVGDYIAERLAQVGVRHHFVVPGDYNLVLLDKLAAHRDLTEIGCANELNCSLAAEGYARAVGVAAAVVTYSVGALSAFNGVGSAYAENLPLILISGSPNTNDAPERRILHHTLGEHDFTYQLDMARKIVCCAVAIGSALEAPRLVDRAIREALAHRKPAYIELPTNLAGAPCVQPTPISAVTDLMPTNADILGEALNRAVEYLHDKAKPIILVGPKVRRAGADDELMKLAQALGCAVVVQPAAKGSFPEDHPQFAGIFWGQVSTLGADTMVNWADAVLCIGTVLSDYSTVGWTAMPTVPLLHADMEHVTFPDAQIGRIRLADFLSELAERVSYNAGTLVEYNRIRPEFTRPLDHVRAAEPAARLTRKEIARQLQDQLDQQGSDTAVLVDTGDSWFNAMKLSLPAGAEFEIEMQWGHIGWSIPAALGYALGRPCKKILVMVGDGAFQVTAQEVSQMVRHRLPIVLLLINNAGYTIEVEIHDGEYNRIKNWDYAAMVEAFNAGDGCALGIRATTARELREALQRASLNTEGPTLVECVVHRDDCSRELINWGHFVATANARPPRRVESS
jgi:pyruvate decarboxylase